MDPVFLCTGEQHCVVASIGIGDIPALVINRLCYPVIASMAIEYGDIEQIETADSDSVHKFEGLFYSKSS
jgi:hypothetical protein